MKTLIAAAVASTLILPCAALAQSATSQPQSGRTPPGAQPSPGSIDQRAGTAPSGKTSAATALFNRLDRNDDGFVTRDEARDVSELQGRFVELDKNNDGKISRDEMRELDAGSGATGASSARQR